MPTSALLELAEVLDGAGFAYLEVSGGGVFDSAVHRGVESPWERIRALKARTKTPLALAVRGRFLVGSRPVGARARAPVRRHGGRERHRRLPPARPAERRGQPARRGRGDPRRRARVRRRAPLRQPAATRRSSRPRSAPAGARRRARPAPRSGRAAAAAPRGRARRRAPRALRACRSGSTARAPGGNALALAIEAARAGADLIACAVYPGRARRAPRLRRGGCARRSPGSGSTRAST